MNEKKYILTDETLIVNTHVLHRIKAVKDFGDVKAGELGGFVESESNLSHEGACWVYDEAQVYEEARIYDEALVYGEARIYDEAWVCGEARVFGEARIYGKAQVYGKARVYGEASIADQYDILQIPNIGSRKGTTTFFKTKTGEIYVACGCFKGTVEEFEKAVEKTHGKNKHGIVYKAAIQMAKTALI